MVSQVLSTSSTAMAWRGVKVFSKSSLSRLVHIDGSGNNSGLKY